MTDRDRVWDATLRILAHPGQQVRNWRVRQQADLPDEKSRTVRRTLKEMERLGWVERPNDQSHTWKPGPKARKYLEDRM